MQVSRLVRQNLTIDSQSYKDLSPVMKEAVSDVFKLIEKSTGDIIKNFEGAVDKVSQYHNINILELNNYFDKEIKEQLEGK
tara:strand:+ start:566 stop:808 length:243 start_codon:yes stop_codon:yes gene_type:complete